MDVTPVSATRTRVTLVDWQVCGCAPDGASTTVRAPHDAMLGAPRHGAAPGGSETAWFTGGDYDYRTTWVAPPERAGRRACLQFEGVQGEAAVLVGGTPVGTLRSGYTEFELPIEDHLRWGQANEIRVQVSHRDQPGERWYPGSGLYRPVHILLRPGTGLGRDGVRVRTVHLDEVSATVAVEVRVEEARSEVRVEEARSEVSSVEETRSDARTRSGVAAEETRPGVSVREARSGVSVSARLHADGEVVAEGVIEAAAGAILLEVPRPRPWSAEDPHLYDLTVSVLAGGEVLDTVEERVGLRTIEVDARRGLRVNGREVLLRGACIHHDNGILGAATHRAAEYRRVRLLKEAGFTAIRSAHNPMSRHLLDACDELGMYVLDELADHWFVRKTAHDDSYRFRRTWREDAEAMIAKDRNRPCVILYSIGNEIPETATPAGVDLAREIADHVRAGDPDRPVTLAVNLFLNAMVSLKASPYRPERADSSDGGSMAGSTEANVMVNHLGKMMSLVSRLPRADAASRDAFAQVDVAGYNYGLARYRGDVRRYPDRVVLGTETLPGDVARAWEAVREHPAVIGDFVWTGWEYLGETGVAVWVPGRRAGLAKPYPYLVAGPGMFDLTGRPDVSLRLAQAAWGRLEAPAVAVRPLDRSGVPYMRSAWRVTDAVESWSWRGCEGRRAEIEVYASEEEVEVFQDGRSLGRRRAGRRRGYLARYTTRYRPGTLEAVGYRAGRAVSRTVLRSAGPALGVRLVPESPVLTADGQDLAFVHVELADDAGQVEMLVEDRIDLAVSGPAQIVGVGTAAPATEESFLTPWATTYRGRALAILRSTGGEGIVRLLARSAAHGSASADIVAMPVPLPLTCAPASR